MSWVLFGFGGSEPENRKSQEVEVELVSPGDIGWTEGNFERSFWKNVMEKRRRRTDSRGRIIYASLATHLLDDAKFSNMSSSIKWQSIGYRNMADESFEGVRGIE